jgi:hypothetical protein
VTALDTAFEAGLKDAFFGGQQQGHWDLLESLVAQHLDEIGAATDKCCVPSLRVRLMANLLRAEKNLSYDRSSLSEQKQPAKMTDALSQRVSRFRQPAGR